MGRSKAISASHSNLSNKEAESTSDLLEYVDTNEVVSTTLNVEDDNPRASDWVVFRLVNSNRHGRIHIHGECAAINPITKKIDTIHLIRNEDEIWGSKLKEKYGSQFLEIIRNRRDDIIFEDRTLRIPVWDMPAIEFMRNNKDCIDNKNRKGGGKNEFFEYNPHRQAELALAKQQKVVEAMQVCFELTDITAKKLVLFYGIPLNDELGEIKTNSLLKRDLALKAQSDPEKFIALVNDPIVEISFMISKALIENKIDISTHTGKAYFSTGGFICSIPNGAKPKNHLLEFATLGSNESKQFVQNLKNILSL